MEDNAVNYSILQNSYHVPFRDNVSDICKFTQNFHTSNPNTIKTSDYVYCATFLTLPTLPIIHNVVESKTLSNIQVPLLWRKVLMRS